MRIPLESCMGLLGSSELSHIALRTERADDKPLRSQATAVEGRKQSGSELRNPDGVSVFLGGLTLPRLGAGSKAASFGLAAIAVVLVLGSSCMDDPYKTNPNLVLLYANGSASAFNPVPSLDGRRIYFLEDSAFEGKGEAEALEGDLHVLDLETRTERRLLSGSFNSLDLSSDGQRILLAGDRMLGSAGLLIITDTALLQIDTVPITHDPAFWGARFRWLGDRVAYSVAAEPVHGNSSTSFYSKSLDGDTATRLETSVPWYQHRFDVITQESLYADSMTRFDPAVNPASYRWAVEPGHAPSRELARDVWYLYDRIKRRRGRLPEDSRPYFQGSLYSPRWTAGGRDLLFAADKTNNTQLVQHFQIWLLRDALE
jgi:hypothetical protein